MYLTGHVKRDSVTGAVAIRTRYDDTEPQLERMAWHVSTTNTGARNAATVEVEQWDDLFVPEPGS